MRTRKLIILIALSIFFLFLFGIAKIHVTNFRDSLNYSLQVSAVPVPPTLLKALAGEFKGVVANYLLLESASFLGANTDVKDSEWDTVARLIDQSSVLDPYFKQTYSFAQGTLPWFAHKYKETLTILERSKQHRTWDWVPGFFIGFNHFYFLSDELSASHALMDASKIPGAPASLATWASRLASQVGNFNTAIAFLASIYESTDDEPKKKMLMERIEALKRAQNLQQAVDHFEATYGRLPNSFDELIENEIISELPENPYSRPFVLNKGRVEF